VTVAPSNRRIVLVRRPTGIPAPSDFARADVPVEGPRDGEFLVRNLLLSIDPAQRGWVNAGANYADPVPIGGVMRSLAVGVVEESRHANVAVGEHLYGWFGWQDYCVGSDAELLRRVDPRQAPLSAALGVSVSRVSQPHRADRDRPARAGRDGAGLRRQRSGSIVGRSPAVMAATSSA
jgi:NADPH-dependent curcumin reductase CurA